MAPEPDFWQFTSSIAAPDLIGADSSPASPLELAPKSIKFVLVISNLVILHKNTIPYLPSGGIHPNGADSTGGANFGPESPSILALLGFEVVPDPIPNRNTESTHLY